MMRTTPNKFDAGLVAVKSPDVAQCRGAFLGRLAWGSTQLNNFEQLKQPANIKER
jgi:hypothetical protein